MSPEETHTLVSVGGAILVLVDLPLWLAVWVLRVDTSADPAEARPTGPGGKGSRRLLRGFLILTATLFTLLALLLIAAGEGSPVARKIVESL